jgi:hypothetical protein
VKRVLIIEREYGCGAGEAQQTVSGNLISLYKALGGGWNAPGAGGAGNLDEGSGRLP